MCNKNSSIGLVIADVETDHMFLYDVHAFCEKCTFDIRNVFNVSEAWLYWLKFVFTFQLSVDSSVNIPWLGFTLAHVCLNPPGSFYMVSILEYSDTHIYIYI